MSSSSGDSRAALELHLANLRQQRHRWPAGRLVGRDRYRWSCRRWERQLQWGCRRLGWQLVHPWQRRRDRWERRSLYRCRRRADRREWRRTCWRQRRISRGARWLWCGWIDDVRGIDRDRRFHRCFRWSGRGGHRGDVWKGRSSRDGGQCRNRRRRQRRQHGDGRHIKHLHDRGFLDRRSAVHLEQRGKRRQRLLLSTVVHWRLRSHDCRWCRRQVQRHME